MSTTHARLSAIFQEALALPDGERAAFVEASCGGDAALRARVLAMLAADAEPDGFAEPPARTAPRAEEDDDLAGLVLGPWRVVRRLGGGGMGDVHLAERCDGAFEQRVAVKVLKRGLDTGELLRRFLAERRTLAGLRHEGIARLLDGGSLPDGRPYFVMEHVEGEAIDVFCDGRSLSTERRLALFRRVCDAVRHAHAQLVVHCDLKPANILVTPDGTPKLLDFGIAKLLQDDAPALTAVSAGRPMTVEYASPEQVRGERVGTSTDVYSLGVVLYELLTGHRPHGHESRVELERAVRETDPIRPSAAVLRTVQRTGSRPLVLAPDAIARARGDRPEGLARRLSGDLDNIALMALRKEPERRYRSVEQLSEDVQRHLDGLPVVSRAPTLGYRAAKFVRRNRVGVAAATAVAAALVVGLVGVTWKAREAERERQRAETARASAEASGAAEHAAREQERAARLGAESARRQAESVIAFLEEVLGSANPAERGRDVKVLEVLDDAAATVHARFADEPLVEASVRSALGRTFLAVGRLEDARAQHEAALALRRAHLPPDDPQVLATLEDLGESLYALDDASGALALFEQVHAARRARPEPDEEGLLRALNDMAAALQRLGEHARARELYERSLAERRTRYGDGHPLVAEALNNLSAVLRLQGELERAFQCEREALAIRRASLSADHPLVAQSLSNLAVLEMTRGGFEDAEALLREAEAIHRRVLGDAHPDLATDLSNLGTLLHNLGRYDEAERCLRECLDIRRAAFAGDRFVVASTELRYAMTLFALGRLAEAEPLFVNAFGRFEERMGRDDPQTQRVLQAIVLVLEGLGRPEEAARWRELVAAGEGS